MVVIGQLHLPAALPLGETKYQLGGKLCGPESRSGRNGDEKKKSLLLLTGIQPRSSSP